MGILLVVGGVLLGIMDAYGMAKMPISGEESMGSRLPLVAQAVSMVLGLVGVGALLYGVADMIQAAPENSGSKEKEPKLAIADLQQSIQRLETAVQRVADQQRESASHVSTALGNFGGGLGGELGAGDTVAGGAIGNTETMHQMMTMLQEIRELAFLSDSQRQDRLADAHHHRRNYLVAEVQRLMALREWPATEIALAALAGEYPDYSELKHLETQVSAGKQNAEQGAFGQLKERVEDLMAVWAWDQAYAETARFVENFSDHEEGKDLLRRVMTERENYIESTANRLYEEIRTDVDRRSYRRAMANAVKLLECAPGHRKSVAIRGQLKTIRENAEIEERQEQERRIQDMLRNKQFFEAIDLAEDLLQRFPNSPQAGTLQNLLPKMRELAIGSEAEEAQA